MAQSNFFMQVGNQFMQTMLRSPLHGILSRSFMLITVTGRKSGKTYTTPVNYARQGDCLIVISQRDRMWWRNLRGGRAVKLQLQGREVKGWGTVVEDDRGVASSLAGYLTQLPQSAKYLGVTLDSNGRPDNAALAQAAKSRVVVQIQLK